MATLNQEFPEPPPAQAVQHFLNLLDDVSLIQQLLLEETERLRARVRELEAGTEQVRDSVRPAPAEAERSRP